MVVIEKHTKVVETVECIEGGRDEITDGCDLPDLHLYLGDNGEVFYKDKNGQFCGILCSKF